MNKSLSVLIAAFTLTACASQPQDIPASYSSTVQFKDLDCDQLSIEAERVSARVTELHNSLKKRANIDAVQMGVGLVLLWPTLFFLEGGDGVEAADYARLKGERQAIEKVSLKKKYDIRYDPIVPEPSEEADEVTVGKKPVSQQ